MSTNRLYQQESGVCADHATVYVGVCTCVCTSDISATFITHILQTYIAKACAETLNLNVTTSISDTVVTVLC